MIYGIFLIAGLSVGALYALSGVGLVLLYRATGVLNLGYGAIGGIAALTAWQIEQVGGPVWAACLGAIILSTAISSLYGFAVSPFMAYREPVVKAVASIGLALILLGLSNFIWEVTARSLNFATDGWSISLFRVHINGTRLIAFGVAVGATLGIAAYLRFTRMGLLMRSLAENRNLSAMLGIPVRRVEALAWMISGVLAGITGLLLADLVRLDSATLTFMVIPAIAAAVLGRLQSLIITLAGGMFLGVVESMTTLIGPLAPYRSIAPYAVAVFILLWLRRQTNLALSAHD
ncbi:branched-chain amino acid ABC transporter permease [Acidocella sp.]|uniref:branched-chain amino acid ABC transporter permease n=1 Tax=Acidocella sp. TaxID=50710 RepID=UPI003D0692C2